MSRSTPRKLRHRHNPSNGGGAGLPGGGGTGPRAAVTASDYESDAVHYMETRIAPPAPHLLRRTNTELNLSVLQRYLPSIRSILSIAANAVVYVFAPETQSWDKSGAEGTLFVCEKQPAPAPGGGAALPRACVFVLNRRGLDNVVVDLAKVSHCEITAELLIFKLEDAADAGAGAADEEPSQPPKVVGIWIHADEDDTRDVNASIIQELWRQTRLAAESAAASTLAGAGGEGRESVGPAEQATGRKVSLSDLFGQKGSNASHG